MACGKTEKTRAMILDAAFLVFSRKRYSTVTMKDIASECGISRSNIYCYFDSTFEILDELMELYFENESSFFLQAMERGDSATQIIQKHFERQKSALLEPNCCLTQTVVEWLWELGEKQPARSKLLMTRRVNLLTKLVEYGVEMKEFHCNNPLLMSQQLHLLMTGLRISATSMQMDEKSLTGAYDSLSLLLGSSEPAPFL